jgi:hypothetical protein
MALLARGTRISEQKNGPASRPIAFGEISPASLGSPTGLAVGVNAEAKQPTPSRGLAASRGGADLRAGCARGCCHGRSMPACSPKMMALGIVVWPMVEFEASSSGKTIPSSCLESEEVQHLWPLE